MSDFPVAEAKPGHNQPPQETPVEALKRQLREENAAYIKENNDLHIRLAGIPDKIETQDDHDKAAQLGKDITAFERRLSAQKTIVKAPYDELVKAVDGFFGSIAKPLDAVKSRIRSSLSLYLAAKEREERAKREAELARQRELARQAEEERRAKTADFEAAPAPATLTPAIAAEDRARSVAAAADRAAARAEAPASALARTTTSTGVTTTLRRVIKVVVNNPQQVPPEFLIVNETAIKAAWRNGRKDIPGVTITEESEAGWR